MVANEKHFNREVLLIGDIHCVNHDPVIICSIVFICQSVMMNTGKLFTAAPIRSLILHIFMTTNKKQKQTQWPLVRERTTPTERPPIADEI
jgi:hypothetical protein